LPRIIQLKSELFGITIVLLCLRPTLLAGVPQFALKTLCASLKHYGGQTWPWGKNQGNWRPTNTQGTELII